MSPWGAHHRLAWRLTRMTSSQVRWRWIRGEGQTRWGRGQLTQNSFLRSMRIKVKVSGLARPSVILPTWVTTKVMERRSRLWSRAMVSLKASTLTLETSLTTSNSLNWWEARAPRPEEPFSTLSLSPRKPSLRMMSLVREMLSRPRSRCLSETLKTRCR